MVIENRRPDLSGRAVLDRGAFIRRESGYDAPIGQSAGRLGGKRWTAPRASLARNIHYVLGK